MKTISTTTWPLRPERQATIRIPVTPIRYHAIAMELAAYLDGQYVEMHILADTGQTIVIVCDKSSIFSIKDHIEQIGRACPEISAWKSTRKPEIFFGKNRTPVSA